MAVLIAFSEFAHSFCLLHKYFILNFVYPIDYANDDNDVDSDMEQTEAETDDDDDNEAIVDGFIFKLRFYIRWNWKTEVFLVILLPLSVASLDKGVILRCVGVSQFVYFLLLMRASINLPV